MKALDAAVILGVPESRAMDYLVDCEEVVEADHYVATLKETTVHLAVQLHGLNGRRVLRECRATLRRWFEKEPILFAPIRHGNVRAVRIAEALGFHIYAESETHVWLMQTKERFNGH